MTTFYMNEGRFDLPDTAVDCTVTYLVGRSPGGASVMLLVERRPLPTTMSLRQAVDALGRSLMLRHLGHTVLFDREVAAHPAIIDVGARWLPEGREPVYTRRVHLLMAGATPVNTGSESTWLIITGETSFTERGDCDACVDHVLASLQLRG